MVLGLLPELASAQLNMLDHDKKSHYFGITMGINSSRFKVYKSAMMILNDTILTVNTKAGPGFNLGIMSNLRINKRFDLRAIPAMVFGEKNLVYLVRDYSIKKDTVTKFNIQNIYFDMPVQIKFKSDRYKDFRMYMIGGGKYSYDLAALGKARKATNIVKLNANDISAEFGIGAEFYFPLFILAPELKISHGLNNILFPDHHLIFSSVLDKLKSRTLTFSLHIQG